MALAPPEIPGITTRAAGTTDLAAVADLFAVAYTLDRGEPGLSLEDIDADWSLPDADLSTDTVVVHEGAQLVGYAAIYHWRAEATVHPRARGRGIGTWLVRWTEAARSARVWPGEEARIGQTIVDSNADAADLLITHGYSPRHTSWELRLPKGRVIEDAFNEWPNRTPSTYEKWEAMILGRTDFDARLLFVALQEREVIGASVGLIYPEVGIVEQIAVQSSHRHLGVARALMKTTFTLMEELGAPEVGLSTDSRTGALDLYLAMGMDVIRSYTHYSKLLVPR